MKHRNLIGMCIMFLLVMSVAQADLYDDMKGVLDRARDKISGKDVQVAPDKEQTEPDPGDAKSDLRINPNQGDLQETIDNNKAHRDQLQKLAGETKVNPEDRDGILGKKAVERFDESLMQMLVNTKGLVLKSQTADPQARQVYAQIISENMNAVGNAVSFWGDGLWAEKYEQVRASANAAVGSDGSISEYISESDYAKPIPDVQNYNIKWQGSTPNKGIKEEQEIKKILEEGDRGPLETAADWVGVGDTYRKAKTGAKYGFILIALVLVFLGYYGMKSGGPLGWLKGAGFLGLGGFLLYMTGLLNWFTLTLGLIVTALVWSKKLRELVGRMLKSLTSEAGNLVQRLRDEQSQDRSESNSQNSPEDQPVSNEEVSEPSQDNDQQSPPPEGSQERQQQTPHFTIDQEEEETLPAGGEHVIIIEGSNFNTATQYQVYVAQPANSYISVNTVACTSSTNLEVVITIPANESAGPKILTISDGSHEENYHIDVFKIQ